jgi:Ca-activated chloride channel family protein
MMDWLHPTYGWFALGVLGAAGLVAWATWRRWQDMAAFGDTALVQALADRVRPRRRYAKGALSVVGLALLVVALMGPRFGTQVRTVERTGVDLVIALDVSESMHAEDVPPSRLERAKNEIQRLVNGLSGDRVGLVLFAGDGFVQAPLTTDYDAIRLFLDIAGPDLMPTPGTDFGAALRAARQAFDTARPPGDTTAANPDPRTRALLVVSDGENHEGSVSALRQTAQENNIRLFTAGVGETGGARIPIYRDGQQVGVKEDRQGRIVRTRLREDVLQRLAQNGAYFRIAATSSALGDFRDALRQLERSTFDAQQFEEYAEMYQWPLALGLLCLAIAVLIPVRALSDRASVRVPWISSGIEAVRSRGEAPSGSDAHPS